MSHAQPQETRVPVHAVTELKANALLMTCQVVVTSPDGASKVAQALLDSASSASFISKRLVSSLRRSRSHHTTKISGIAGLSHDSRSHSVADFVVCPRDDPSRQFRVSAIVVPKVTCDLPVHPVPLDSGWSHLEGLHLADPHFGSPGAIDLLLGVDLFVETLRHGRRQGPPGAPRALETEFGWVLAGAADHHPLTSQLVSHHVALSSGDDLLRKFWEVEESPPPPPPPPPKAQSCQWRRRQSSSTSNPTTLARQMGDLSYLCRRRWTPRAWASRDRRLFEDSSPWSDPCAPGINSQTLRL